MENKGKRAWIAAMICIALLAAVVAAVPSARRERAEEPAVEADGGVAATPLSFGVLRVEQGALFRTVDVTIRATGYAGAVEFIYLLLSGAVTDPTAAEVLNYSDSAKLIDGTAARGRGSIGVHGGVAEVTFALAGRGMGTTIPNEAGVVDGLNYRAFIVLINNPSAVVTTMAGDAAPFAPEESSVVYTSAQRGMGMPFDSGSGTLDDPYLIRQLTVSDMARYPDLLPGHPNNTMGMMQDARMLDNIENMTTLYEESGGAAGMADALTLAYGLLTDLHLGNYTTRVNNGQGWRPIGSNLDDGNPHVFTGVLTSVGALKTIYDLEIAADASGGDAPPVRSAGLFGKIAYPAVISNIRFSGATVSADLDATAPSGGRTPAGAGVVAGTADGAVVRGVTVTNSVLRGGAVEGSDESVGVGGLVGTAVATAFEGCAVQNTTVQGDNTRAVADCGGMVGTLITGDARLSQMTDCAARNVLVRNHTNTGGLAGALIALDDMTLDGCTVDNSTVFGVVNAGGVAGKLGVAASEGDTVSIQHLTANNVSVQKNGAVQANFFGGGFGNITHTRSLIDATEATVVLSNSAVRAAVTGDNYCGGFSGICASEEGCDITVRAVETDAQVSGTVNVGGFAGGNQSNFFEDCSASGTVTAVQQAGGFVGTVTQGDVSHFTDCAADSAVSATTQAGGFVGAIQNAEVQAEGCTAGGDVTITGNYAGGFAGAVAGGEPSGFQSCAATGNVEAAQHAGGFLGTIQSAVVKADACTAAGDVTVYNSSAGGFLGDSRTNNTTPGSELTNCSATGDVRATDKRNTAYARVGGFVGRSGYIKIDRCYATGDVSGGGMGGGFLGTNESSSFITNCYATGGVDMDVNSPANASGGFAGVCASGGVRFCYSSGDVTGYSQAGGFSGRQEDTGQITSVVTLDHTTRTVQPGGSVGRVIGAENKPSYVANIFGERSMVLRRGGSPVGVTAQHKEGAAISADELQNKLIPLSWDTDVWDFGAIDEVGRPLLISNPEP